jgi:autophagy-related protein 5
MSLGKEPSTQLWEAVENGRLQELCAPVLTVLGQLPMFVKVHEKLVHPVGENLRHIPIKIYLPSVDAGDQISAGHLRVVQGLVAPFLSSRKPFALLRIV